MVEPSLIKAPRGARAKAASGFALGGPRFAKGMGHVHNTSRFSYWGGPSALALSGLSRARAAGTTIGFIYVGSKTDYGWNQSHAVAAATLKNTPGITVVEEENVPERLRSRRP